MLTTVLLISVLLIVSLLQITGCVPSQVATADIFRIGVSKPIDSLNPFVADTDYSNVAFEYAYPFLTIYSKNMKIIPYFAKSWNVSKNHKVWTFHTIPNAKWSDGLPIDANDAAFTFNMIVKYKNGSTGKLAGWLSHLVKAKATGPNTLVLTYNVPTSNVPTQLQAVPILPPQVWSKLAVGDGSKIFTFNNSTPWISGGPFVFKKYERGQLALFMRNPNWWGKKKPSIKGFGLQFFANPDAMVASLISGQLDMIGEKTPPTTVAALRKANMVVSSWPSTGFRDIIINTNPNKKIHRELLNPNVRKAFEYAIDRKKIVNLVWLGYATIGSTIVAPSTGWHDDTIKPLPFDLTKASALLDEAGFKKGSDGIRIAHGHPMAYNVIFPTEINGTG
ncbi:MAG: ABC transporter substrate-binding protein, partial [Halothiobacillus sp.]|nr:ABC transporter substrate-binding protein [Halothiobacillus sp.]